MQYDKALGKLLTVEERWQIRYADVYLLLTSQALFPTTPAHQNVQAIFLTSTPTPFSKHQYRPSPPGNLACNLASTFPNQPRPSKFPSTFSKRRTPSVFQALYCTQRPRTFFCPCNFLALAWNCTLQFTTNTQKSSQELSRCKNISCRGDLPHVVSATIQHVPPKLVPDTGIAHGGGANLWTTPPYPRSAPRAGWNPRLPPPCLPPNGKVLSQKKNEKKAALHQQPVQGPPPPLERLAATTGLLTAQTINVFFLPNSTFPIFFIHVKSHCHVGSTAALL